MTREELEREAYIYTQEKMVHYSADQNEVIDMLTDFAEELQKRGVGASKLVDELHRKIDSLEKQLQTCQAAFKDLRQHRDELKAELKKLKE